MRASPAERARRTERGAPLSAVTTASGQPRPRAAAACVGLGLGLAPGLSSGLGSGVANQMPALRWAALAAATLDATLCVVPALRWATPAAAQLRSAL